MHFVTLLCHDEGSTRRRPMRRKKISYEIFSKVVSFFQKVVTKIFYACGATQITINEHKFFINIFETFMANYGYLRSVADT